MAYLIATNLAGNNVWFEPGEPIPPSMINVRPASARVELLADRMMAEDRSGQISDDTAAAMIRALDAA